MMDSKVVKKLDLWCSHGRFIGNVKDTCHLYLISKSSKRADDASIFFVNQD
jgi:hypothetical protein